LTLSHCDVYFIRGAYPHGMHWNLLNTFPAVLQEAAADNTMPLVAPPTHHPTSAPLHTL